MAVHLRLVHEFEGPLARPRRRRRRSPRLRLVAPLAPFTAGEPDLDAGLSALAAELREAELRDADRQLRPLLEIERRFDR
jgi:hypothetical protein